MRRLVAAEFDVPLLSLKPRLAFVNRIVAPDSLMVILKQGLGKHIKANAYSYRQAIDREEARIQRVGDLKDRAFQAIWTVFAAAWIALFGFIGRIAWAEWGGDIVGEVLASSSAAD